MAPWQFRTKIAPRAAPPTEILHAMHGETMAGLWTYSSAPAQVEARLSKLLPEVSSWSSSARMFGDSKGDQIEIWKDGDQLAWVGLAFSLFHPNSDFIKQAVATVAALDCLFVGVQSKAPFEPKLGSFVEHAQQCSAARYIPNGWSVKVHDHDAPHIFHQKKSNPDDLAPP